MKTTTNILTTDLLARIDSVIDRAKRLRESGIEKLNAKKAPAQWSALECIEHLNLYGDFYLPEIEKQLDSASKAPANAVFKSGVIGNYFAGLMQKNKKGKLKKMKAPKDKTPAVSVLTLVTIERFLKQAEKLKQLMTRAALVDLTKTKTAISLTKLIRLRLGDTLRFVVYHMERHLDQAERAVSE